jgi:hypothetical protein
MDLIGSTLVPDLKRHERDDKHKHSKERDLHHDRMREKRHNGRFESTRGFQCRLWFCSGRYVAGSLVPSSNESA